MANAKRKCTFTNEMQEKHPCFRKGRNDYKAECLVCKLISIYTVRTEQLKEYCEFVICEYKRLLSHSKTRWLFLFPGISRLLEMFSPLKSYFLSQEHPPIVIKRFFENDMS